MNLDMRILKEESMKLLHEIYMKAMEEGTLTKVFPLTLGNRLHVEYLLARKLFQIESRGFWITGEGIEELEKYCY